ncbi:helix-turn-helix domain-containing protein [Streptomyces profundus]|uniref:helix-turn-helix domain-containing protein n=1 Tax=Streptomyces profundus TaxID=2867410 RepID=UPI001D16B76E|nr:helix-turn-helix transcriptional regulator [Streptomyces sp. MA3_2.13]UED85204.1 helix-turn-helix domain-containing protein [Streptomyces sp. MA3_2.13]
MNGTTHPEGTSGRRRGRGAGALTPNGTAIRAIRTTQGISLRDLAERTGIDKGNLSRLERGQTRASQRTIELIARALDVPPHDLVRPADIPGEEPLLDPRDIPAPTSEEGALFHYTPEEAAHWTPYTPRQLRAMARTLAIPHHQTAQGRITLTGHNIRTISHTTNIPPATTP